MEKTKGFCYTPSKMKAKSSQVRENMRPEYHFDYSKAVRGKHHKRLLAEGANVVVLEPDVAEAFGSSEAVNDALRSLLAIARATQRRAGRASARRQS